MKMRRLTRRIQRGGGITTLTADVSGLDGEVTILSCRAGYEDEIRARWEDYETGRLPAHMRHPTPSWAPIVETLREWAEKYPQVRWWCEGDERRIRVYERALRRAGFSIITSSAHDAGGLISWRL